MIAEFVESWDLFSEMYITGWLIAAVLSLVGVVVVARDQIFLGAAISQASLLGVSVSILVGSELLHAQSFVDEKTFHTFCGVCFAVAAALLTARGGRKHGESHEAVTGWVFLLGGSLSVILMANDPHGLEEVKQLLSVSSVLGATRVELWAMVVLLTVTLGFVLARSRLITLLVVDPETAAALGLSSYRRQAAISIWLGLAVGLSLHASGVAYTFACLVLPPLAAKSFCREIRQMLWLSPLLGVGVAVLSFIVAHHYDYPPGQTTVVGLCVVVMFAWVVRSLRLTWGRRAFGLSDRDARDSDNS